MKRKRYTEAQSAFALLQAESGSPVAECGKKSTLKVSCEAETPLILGLE